MSAPATEGWFSLRIRRNRKSFILAGVLLIAVFLAVLLGLSFFEAQGRGGLIIFWLFFIPYAVCCYSLTSQRLRDFNVTGWLALLWKPISIADRYIGGAASLAFFLVLCAVPGTQGENRYGPDPLD